MEISKGCVFSPISGHPFERGQLKPEIMVDGSGNARIMDFGLAGVVRGPNPVASTGYSPRWTAPEILRDGTPPNKKSDVFSFAMVIYEVSADRYST